MGLGDITDDLYDQLFRLGKYKNAHVPMDPKEIILEALEKAYVAGGNTQIDLAMQYLSRLKQTGDPATGEHEKCDTYETACPKCLADFKEWKKRQLKAIN